MKNNASLKYNLFLIIGDILSLIAAFAGAYILRVSVNHKAITYQVDSRTYIGVFLALVPFWILIFAMVGLYSSNIYEKRFNELGRLLIGSFIGLLFVVFWDFVSATPIFPAKLVPIYGFILAFTFLVIFRNLIRFVRGWLHRYGIGINNVLIVGNTSIAGELINSMMNSKTSGYKIIGVVGHKLRSEFNKKIRVFDSFDESIKSIGADNLHSIIQTELYSKSQDNNEILSFAQTNHIAYRFVPGNSELFVGNIDVDLFRSQIPVIAVHQTALLGWGRIVKRLFDVLVSIFLLIIFSPILIVIALLELLSGNSIFFRQVRLTRFNQKFRVYKFQTMYKRYSGITPEEAFEKMKRPELIREFRENGNQLALDPRVSRLGRILRRLSLDELPQLLNVLKGDLSLVGPRALVPEDLSEYEKKHSILSVKSGLTGLAQVSGRNDITFDERRQLDMYYVQNWSFWFDLVILAKTVRVVFKGS